MHSQGNYRQKGLNINLRRQLVSTAANLIDYESLSSFNRYQPPKILRLRKDSRQWQMITKFAICNCISVIIHQVAKYETNSINGWMDEHRFCEVNPHLRRQRTNPKCHLQVKQQFSCARKESCLIAYFLFQIVLTNDDIGLTYKC